MTTAIEWTEATWNPTTGCDRVSPGCDHCYAMTMAKRLKGMGQPKYQNDGDPKTSGPGFGITEHADTLDAPLRWKKPRKIFVNSMSDLFHSGVSDEFIARVWAVMALTPHHTYQILTKRHARMRATLSAPGFRSLTENDWMNLRAKRSHQFPDKTRPDWPLPNVHLGVSAENQKWADVRIPALLETPAAVRWVSAEPLLGPVDLGEHTWALDWLVAGGESGPGARPMHPAWARSLRDQCVAHGVPFLFKQWGAWSPDPSGHQSRVPDVLLGLDGKGRVHAHASDAVPMYCVGKHDAGRELDGEVWDEYPEAAR